MAGKEIDKYEEAIEQEIATINTKILNFSFVAWDNIAPQATKSYSNETAQAIFVIIFGTWNFSQIFLAFPNNGSTPVLRMVGQYQSGASPVNMEVTANGQWGIKVKNTHSSANMPLLLYKIIK